MPKSAALFAIFCFLVLTCAGQVTTGEILGIVQDPSEAAVAEARITVRNQETNATRAASSDAEGRFRFLQLPVGAYELTVEKAGFTKYVRGPIVLRLNQNAELQIELQLAGVAQQLTVTADAPLINTTNAEMGANFDRKRISELPLGPGRNILNLVLSVAGVSQIQSGQATSVPIAGGVPFSANGFRLRSNNFMIDGQDSNSSNITGLNQQIQNPDIVAEVRLITNQFAPEYGRASGSVVNIITKSGTNRFHGSAFWFHNDNHLNSRSNLDKVLVGSPPQAKFVRAPFRIENQFGGTLGGPLKKDRTFFFGSVQRWTDRRFASGVTIIGVPTEEGRSQLRSLAGSRPTVQALLEHLPPAQAPVPGRAASLTVGGRTAAIPLGSLSGSSNVHFNDWQWSARVDHRLNDRHTLGGRYLFDDRLTSGDGQKTPPGLTTVNPQRSQAATAFLNSGFSPTLYNELRASFRRFAGSTTAANPDAERIPAIQVPELGLTGTLPNASRKAIGVSQSLPMSNFDSVYQLQETIGLLRGPHSMKFGIDFRRRDVINNGLSQVRGVLDYTTLQNLVEDGAQTATITRPLPGGGVAKFSRSYEFFFFLQDEWRVRPNLTITYGVRYESHGNPFDKLRRQSDQIVAAAGGDERFRVRPASQTDLNNWAARFGFNYRFGAGPAILRWLTGAEKLVVRGGYSRSYDPPYAAAVGDMRDRFPFTVSPPLSLNNAFQTVQGIRAGLIPLEVGDPDLLTRVTVGEDFRSQYAEHFALQFQRELAKDWALSVGWIGTKGTALTQLLDGNPTVPGARGRRRVNPARGVVASYCNCTGSVYHSLQTSLEKRLSTNFSMAAHYTWSAFIDGASDNFASSAGDPPLAQDPFDRRASRGRSSFDRPHRLAANGVYELPFRPKQKGLAGKLLGGWQLSGFLMFQSGAPFAAVAGMDPDFRYAGGLETIRQNPIRPHLDTNLNLAGMSVEEIFRAGGVRLFSQVTAERPLGNLGRNILRADGIANVDLGIIKNTRVSETNILQFRAEFYNTANTRNFGIPEPRLTATSNFLNQWGTDAGNRRIVLALRYVF